MGGFLAKNPHLLGDHSQNEFEPLQMDNWRYFYLVDKLYCVKCRV